MTIDTSPELVTTTEIVTSPESENATISTEPTNIKNITTTLVEITTNAVSATTSTEPKAL